MHNSITRRTVILISACTALALFGDTTLYAVLPSHYSLVGITALQVGTLLSANRLVRLPLNLPSGWLAEHLGPKWPYIMGLVAGAASTVAYGLFTGFWPLLAARALWGVAWSLLAVASYSMVLDITSDETRGRYTGFYDSFAFFGGAVGAMLGGFMADALGFRPTMVLLGACTALACLAALWLPDPAGARSGPRASAVGLRVALRTTWSRAAVLDRRLWLILGLNLIHRLLFAGVFYSTFGLYLQQTLGDTLRLGAFVVGVASLTGTLLFVRNVVAVVVVPMAGYLSDRLGDRRYTLLLGSLAGALGLATMAVGRSPWTLGAGVLLVACAYGLVPPMLVAWMGDLVAPGERGPVLGSYQTMGDLGSGVGPLVAYALADLVGLRTVYGLAAALLAGALGVALSAGSAKQRQAAVLE